jgi:hypothetical protein
MLGGVPFRGACPGTVCIDHNGRLPAMFGEARAILYGFHSVRSPFVDAIEVSRHSADTPDFGGLNDVDALRSRLLEQKRVEAVAADRSSVCVTTIEAGRHCSDDSPIAGHPRDLAYRGTGVLDDTRTQTEFVQELQAGRPQALAADLLAREQ